MQRQPGAGASVETFPEGVAHRNGAPPAPLPWRCRAWSSEQTLGIRLHVIRLCTVLPVLILSLLPVRQARALDCTGSPECDDQNECTADACDPTTHTCTNTPIPGPCEDGDACTQNDFCDKG